jgi:hypothetical protein
VRTFGFRDLRENRLFENIGDITTIYSQKKIKNNDSRDNIIIDDGESCQPARNLPNPLPSQHYFHNNVNNASA